MGRPRRRKESTKTPRHSRKRRREGGAEEDQWHAEEPPTPQDNRDDMEKKIITTAKKGERQRPKEVASRPTWMEKRGEVHSIQAGLNRVLQERGHLQVMASRSRSTA
ncbi:hypothetical protein AVEN_200688-1 [Araneus ventricosus]|uniref:Uncharacterized protein n=1 Tax=Araneus ventricosus TaxID=182803 RepID=A0A4Y2QMM0_ARAVE|nr:hypothetical protein AVEN_260650-1 [Araneus ventricosus]GBN64591.1 hypothetical protein AVEN_200688-1 [Araneus ventricosus]